MKGLQVALPQDLDDEALPVQHQQPNEQQEHQQQPPDEHQQHCHQRNEQQQHPNRERELSSVPPEASEDPQKNTAMTAGASCMISNVAKTIEPSLPVVASELSVEPLDNNNDDNLLEEADIVAEDDKQIGALGKNCLFSTFCHCYLSLFKWLL